MVTNENNLTQEELDYNSKHCRQGHKYVPQSECEHCDGEKGFGQEIFCPICEFCCGC